MADETQSGRDDRVTSESGQAPVPWRTDNRANPVQELTQIITVDPDSGEVTEERRFARRPRLVLTRIGSPDKRDLCSDVQICVVTSTIGKGDKKTYGVKMSRADGTEFTDSVEETGIISETGRSYEEEDVVLVMTDGAIEDGGTPLFVIVEDLVTIRQPFRAKVIRINVAPTDYDIRAVDDNGDLASGVAEASGYSLTEMMLARANRWHRLTGQLIFLADALDKADRTTGEVVVQHGAGWGPQYMNVGFHTSGAGIVDNWWPQVDDFVLAYNNPYGGKYIFDHETLPGGEFFDDGALP